MFPVLDYKGKYLIFTCFFKISGTVVNSRHLGWFGWCFWGKTKPNYDVVRKMD